MAVIDTIEGVIGEDIDFHYDVGNDVLYVRLTAERDADAYGDEDDDGFIIRHRLSDDAVIGVSVVGWWKRFGTGPLPDSLAEIARHVEPAAARLAA